MSTSMHKNSQIKVPHNSGLNMSKIPTDSGTGKENDLQKLYVQDIDKENRLSKITSLYGKGFSQEEIANQIGVDQSTISRDLQLIKREARTQIDKYLASDVLLENIRYLAGSNDVIRELWEVVQDGYSEPRERISALKLLLDAYEKRHQRLICEP